MNFWSLKSGSLESNCRFLLRFTSSKMISLVVLHEEFSIFWFDKWTFWHRFHNPNTVSDKSISQGGYQDGKCVGDCFDIGVWMK